MPGEVKTMKRRDVLKSGLAGGFAGAAVAAGSGPARAQDAGGVTFV